MQTTELSRQTIEQLPHYQRRTAREYSSACPFCGDGTDRFRYWPETGNYWCRRCEIKGFVNSDGGLRFSPEQYREWQEREAERKRAEAERKKTAIERLNERNNASRYHQQLTPTARGWWHSKGLNDASINRWQLGYTSNCPTARGRPSYTIPVVYKNKLYDIRHRLADADNGDKYRPEMPGLVASMFNADVLLDDSGFVTEVVLVEGEIKSMVLQQYGFDAVGIPGKNAFKSRWLKLFGKRQLIYVALDPGADDNALDIYNMLGAAGVPVKLCSFPVKPDDFIVVYGGSAYEFYSYLTLGTLYR